MLKTNRIVSLILAVVLVFSMFAVSTAALADGEVWTVAGAAGLCGSNWDPADSNNQMTWNADKAIYEKVYEGVDAGTFEFKVVMGTKWGTEYNLTGNAGFGAPNASVTVAEAGSTVTVGFDGTKALVDVAAPAGDEPTDAPVVSGNVITVDGVDYPANVGDKFTYYYYLNVTDVTQDTYKPGRIVNIEGSTYFDDSIINVTNYVENEDTGLYDAMFPVLNSMGLVCNQLDDEITYNASNLNGLRFDNDNRIVIKMEFEVVAEGSTEINTIIKNSQKFGPEKPEDDLVIIIEDGIFKGDAWKTREELIADPNNKPVETQAPVTEPAPTETEPAPTETTAPADPTYTVAGAIAPGHTDGGILGTSWDPTNVANDLTFDEATGLWSITYTDVPATGETEDYDDTWYEYKVVENHAWDRSFNNDGEIFGPGTNAQFRVTVDGSSVTIFFDGSKCWAEGEGVISGPTEAPTEEIPTETEPTPTETEEVTEVIPTETTAPAGPTYTVAGALAPGHTDGGILGTSWDPTNTANDLTFDEATGLWSITYTDVPATGETDDYDETWYEYKVVENHAWDRSFTHEGEVFGPGTNASFDVTVDGTTVTIFFDGTKCWAEGEGVVGPTEAPTEIIPTETEEVTEVIPTETEPAKSGAYVRIDDGSTYPVIKGEKYRYTFYMTVEDKIGSFDASTWYDVDGLKVCPIVDEYGDDDTVAMFPGFGGNVVYNLLGEAANGEILYNYSSVSGVRFNKELAVFSIDFEVTADEGIYDIWTTVRTVANTNMDRYWQYGQELKEGCIFRSDLNGNFRTEETVPTETQPVETQPTPSETVEPTEPTPTETEPAPTETEPTEPAPTEAPAKVFIRVDKDDERVYPVETGKTYTYEYYLACDKKISSLDCTTWFDTTGLDFVPAVDEYGDYTGAEMPNLPAPVYNYDIDGEILYNFSNVAGVRFPVPEDLQPTEKNLVFRGQFTVTAEEGILDIWTDLKVLGDTDNNKIVFGSELVDETVNVYEEERIADLIPGTLPTVPTEPTEPAPTEPTPTEPAPTEPVPTEPVPTEPTPTEPAPTEPTPTEPGTDAPTEDETKAPTPATGGQSSTGNQKNPTNNNGVKTGSTTTAIAFLTVLVMAAGVVMFARKRKFD